MTSPAFVGYAFNRTRNKPLATHVRAARTHWSRLWGLMCVADDDFPAGYGLWIQPSQGVHTFAMRFPIDVLYLDRELIVVYLGEQMKPWRIGPIKRKAKSVLELPGGTLEGTGTRVGDKIEISVGDAREEVTA